MVLCLQQRHRYQVIYNPTQQRLVSLLLMNRLLPQVEVEWYLMLKITILFYQIVSLTPLVNINAGSSLQSPQAGSTITEYKYAGLMSTLSSNASSGTLTVSPTTDYPHQTTSDNFSVSVNTSHQFNFTYIGGSSSTQCVAKGQGSYAVQILYLEIHGNSSFTDLQHTVFLRTLSAYGWDISSGESEEEGLMPEGGIESVVGDTDMLMAAMVQLKKQKISKKVIMFVHGMMSTKNIT